MRIRYLKFDNGFAKGTEREVPDHIGHAFCARGVAEMCDGAVIVPQTEAAATTGAPEKATAAPAKKKKA